MFFTCNACGNSCCLAAASLAILYTLSWKRVQQVNTCVFPFSFSALAMRFAPLLPVTSPTDELFVAAKCAVLLSVCAALCPVASRQAMSGGWTSKRRRLKRSRNGGGKTLTDSTQHMGVWRTICR